MILAWISPREIITPDGVRQGPCVFEATKSYYHRARHPALIEYRLLYRVSKSRLSKEQKEELIRQGEQLLNPDLTKCSYRELQAKAKELGIKAGGSHEDLLARIQEDINGSL